MKAVIRMSIRFTYAAQEAEFDTIVCFVSREELRAEEAADGQWVHPQLDESLRTHFHSKLFNAEPRETLCLATLGLLPQAYVIYVGVPSTDLNADSLRDAAAAAAKSAKRVKAVSVRQILPGGISIITQESMVIEFAQALTEGYLLGSFSRKSEKKDEEKRQSTLQTVNYTHAGSQSHAAASWDAGIRRGTVFAESVGYARDLVNLPGNKLTPEMLAEEAEALALTHGLDCEVLDEWSAAEQGMGGLLGVGQGSANPPRMIVLHYTGAPQDKDVWGLVGKGITFDTGGISLKKPQGMEAMISDMGGAAAVLGAMRIIGELPRNYPVTDNLLPGSREL
ncbi:leucyl aminopeptidase, partial [Paenibacillus sepulcri]|nr:leucyl aminopeptidase [Paenibacillus sepulcri]